MADDNVFKEPCDVCIPMLACACVCACVPICPKLRHCISCFLEAIFISYIKSGTVKTKPEDMHMGQCVYIQCFNVLKKGVSFIFIFLSTRLQNNNN